MTMEAIQEQQQQQQKLLLQKQRQQLEPHSLPIPSPVPQRRSYQRWSRIRRKFLSSPSMSCPAGTSYSSSDVHSSASTPTLESLQKRLKEHEVRAETHICFAKDGSWFQGVINPPQHGVFRICGVKRRRSTIKRKRSSIYRRSSVPTTSAATDQLQQLRVSTDSGRSSCHGAETPPTKQPPQLQRLSESADHTADETGSSCSSSVDCDLLNAIMEKLDLTREDEFVDEAIGDEEEEDFTNDDDEDDGDVENSTTMYRVLVVDYETGIDYKLDKVCVRRYGNSCSVFSDQLNFRSDKCFKGAAADTVLVRHISPSFADQGLKVFRGQVVFKYKDQLCMPVKVEDTKWCL